MTTPIDSRRLLRPFFLSRDGSTSLQTKRYYDVFSWLITQSVFSFTVAPFILLSFHDTVLVWARVWFYGIVGVSAASLFLASPGKAWLQAQVKNRSSTSRPAVSRAESQDTHPTLGLPNDPGKEWDNMVEEISAELEARTKKGQPISEELRQTAARLSSALPASGLKDRIDRSRKNA